MFEERKRSKYYTKGFDYGKQEHKYERYASITLFVMILMFVAGIWFKIEILFFYILFVLALVAFIFRVLAYRNHKLEKKYRTKAVKIDKILKKNNE